MTTQTDNSVPAGVSAYEHSQGSSSFTASCFLPPATIPSTIPDDDIERKNQHIINVLKAHGAVETSTTDLITFCKNNHPDFAEFYEDSEDNLRTYTPDEYERCYSDSWGGDKGGVGYDMGWDLCGFNDGGHSVFVVYTAPDRTRELVDVSDGGERFGDLYRKGKDCLRILMFV